MSDEFWMLIGFVAVAWLLLHPVLIIAGYLRVRRVELRLQTLEHKLSPLGAASAVRAAAPRPATVATTPPATSLTSPAEFDNVFVARDVARGLAGPDSKIAGAVVPEPTSPEPAQALAAASKAGPELEENIWLDESSPPTAGVAAASGAAGVSKWEEVFAGRWLTWAGALALICGAGFFLKYTIDVGWLGPTGRVALGVLTGLVCFVGAAFALQRNYIVLGQGLAGAAQGILYFALFAGVKWYGVLPVTVGFALMILVTASGLLFAVRFNSLSTAILGQLGGFLTPFLLSTGHDAQHELLAYIMILDVGVLGAASFRKWTSLELLSLVGTLLVWMGWLGAHYTAAALWPTLAWMTAFFVLFILLSVWQTIWRKRPVLPVDFILIFLIPLAYFAGLYGLTLPRYAAFQGLMAVALGAVYFGLAAVALRRNPAARSVVASLVGVTSVFFTVAVPLELTGHWVPIAWAVESLVLIELGLYFRERAFRVAGFCLLALVQLVLVTMTLATLGSPERARTDDLVFVPGRTTEAVQMVEQPAEPRTTYTWSDLPNGRALSWLVSAIVCAVAAVEYGRRFSRSIAPAGASPEGIQWSAPRSGVPLRELESIRAVLWALVPLGLLALAQSETIVWGRLNHWYVDTTLSVLALWFGVAASGTWSLMRRERLWTLVWLGVLFISGAALLMGGVTLHTLVAWRWDVAQMILGAAWHVPLFNPRAAGYFGLLAATLLGAWCFRAVRKECEPRPLAEGPPGPAASQMAPAPFGQMIHDARRLPFHYDTMARGLGLLAIITAWAWLTIELYSQGVLRDWHTATSLGITAGWALYAVVLMAGGLAWRQAGPRRAALVIFAVTTAKVFLHDVWYLDPTIRTLAFSGLGAVLLFASYLYRRFGARLGSWITPPLLIALGWGGLGAPSARGQDPAAGPEPAAVHATDDRPLVERLEFRWPVRESDLKLARQAARNSVLRIQFPDELFAVAHPDFRDVRLFAGVAPRAVEIPYVLWLPQDIDRVVARRVELLNLSQRGEDTEFLFENDPEQHPVRFLKFDIDPEDRNYRRRVRVHGADRRDPETWNLLATDYLVEAAQPNGSRLKLAQFEVSLSRFRWHKVIIENGSEMPLRLRGVERLDHEIWRAPRRTHKVRFEPKNEDIPRTTVVQIDLGHKNLPTIELTIEIDGDAEFERTITLEVNENPENWEMWQPVSRGMISRQRRGEEIVDSLTIAYPEIAGRYMRLTILNFDDYPLTVSGIVVAGYAKGLVTTPDAWQRAGDVPVGLYGGGRRIDPPTYDLARLLTDLSEKPIVELALAAGESNAAFVGPIRPWTETHAAWIWGMTLAGVAVLAGATIWLLRRVAPQIPQGP